MNDWTISKLWRRSRPLALLMAALVLFATGVLVGSLILGHPLPSQAAVMWMVGGLVIGIGLATEVYERSLSGRANNRSARLHRRAGPGGVVA